MVQKFITQNGGVLTEVAAKQASSGASDAGSIPALDAAGKLDMSMMPVGLGQDIKSFFASETLAAGDFISIWSDGGAAKVRKADASTAGKTVDGFVLTAAAASSQVVVYFEGTNTQLTGLSIGAPYFLSDSTPGGVTANAPVGAGKVVQRLGKAISATEISLEAAQPIVLA